MFILIALGILFGLVAAVIASQKGRSRLLWFFVGFIFQIIGLVVLFLPPVAKAGVMKKCQACAEIVKAEAKVCRFCGREFADVD
jgi:hypothetical protein